MRISQGAYDELALIDDAALELGISRDVRLPTRRTRVRAAPDGRELSALIWGSEDPEIVFLHGGGQNAHTWDTVCLLMGRPAVAIDLPSHGHSDPREQSPLDPITHALDVAPVIEQLAPRARLIVGMSLGGLTAIALGARFPSLVRGLALVDVTPGSEPLRARVVSDFLTGPETFASAEEMVAYAAAFSPQRPIEPLRRGVLHNSVERGDGRWVWRHCRGGLRSWILAHGVPDAVPLWADVSNLHMPVLLVRGGAAGSVVTDAEVEELRRRVPDVTVIAVPGAGHSVQGDRPHELAQILTDFLAAPSHSR